MYENLELFRTATSLARHAGARQLVVATNMANADTPGYRAMTVAPFAAQIGDVMGLQATRAGHLGGFGANETPRPESAPLSEMAPNGNAVSVELEMLAAADAQREHARALAIWRHGITVIRTALGR